MQSAGSEENGEIAVDADFACTVDSIYTSKMMTQSEVEACKTDYQEACTCEIIYYTCVFRPDSIGELVYSQELRRVAESWGCEKETSGCICETDEKYEEIRAQMEAEAETTKQRLASDEAVTNDATTNFLGSETTELSSSEDAVVGSVEETTLPNSKEEE